ncbi:hypothetical protein D3C80_1315670 [compost metagenome]
MYSRLPLSVFSALSFRFHNSSNARVVPTRTSKRPPAAPGVSASLKLLLTALATLFLAPALSGVLRFSNCSSAPSLPSRALSTRARLVFIGPSSSAAGRLCSRRVPKVLSNSTAPLRRMEVGGSLMSVTLTRAWPLS